jgi:hypothetical protein
MLGTGIGFGNGPSKVATAAAKVNVNTAIRNAIRMTLPSICLFRIFRVFLEQKAYKTAMKIT